MEPLTTTTRTIHEVKLNDLESFARTAYKLRDYSFLAVEADNDDETLDFPFTAETLDAEQLEDDAEDIAIIRAGGPVPLWRNDLLLDLLCTDGLIKPGYYLVTT